MTGDEKGGWHHQLNGQESEENPGDSEEQGSLAPGLLQFTGSQRVGQVLITKQQQSQTENEKYLMTSLICGI